MVKLFQLQMGLWVGENINCEVERFSVKDKLDVLSLVFAGNQ